MTRSGPGPAGNTPTPTPPSLPPGPRADNPGPDCPQAHDPASATTTTVRKPISARMAASTPRPAAGAPDAFAVPGSISERPDGAPQPRPRAAQRLGQHPGPRHRGHEI